ncbi:MAG: type II toxin-antitoxin system HicB family antitoxin [Candidatus Altiarchaeota archaeon]|jgi:predicted RNase H-like HicB family nuclease|nr:type II toxin-antitoxin system HicB family antitoxin [Candidatus Altiarchaeota archaeon]
MKRSYTVIIEKDNDTGMYVGEVSGISGCHSQGKTIDELMKRMQEVISLCLEEGIGEDMPKFVGVQQVEVPA